MKKKIFILILIIIGMAFVAGVYWFSVPAQKNIKKENQIKNTLDSGVPGKTIEVKIDNGAGEVKTVSAEYESGMTAYDALRNGAGKNGLEIKTKQYDMGIFIESIGGAVNGQDGKYWLYYVNDKMPEVAADKLVIGPEDKIEFKFEKSPF